MPLIEVKIYDRRVTDENAQKIIEAMTNGLASVYGDEIKAHTWVIVDGVKPQNWGIAGQQGS
jgi:4-oxalocrotonate tautomerase